MTVVDIQIKNVSLFQAVTQSFVTKHIYIKKEKIYHISSEEEKTITANSVIDGQGLFMVPGLIDSHMHIESSMCTPESFSDAVLQFGVTTVVADAHEIGNVFGIEGLNHFMSAQTELDIFHGIPSSVPSTTTELETTGGVIAFKEVEELLNNPKVICLGEAMNFKGISYEPDSLIAQIIRLIQEKRPTMPLEGHCPKIQGTDLSDFLYSGISSDHTHQFPESLKERIENGVFIQLQAKSMTKENMAVITEGHFYEYASIVTDDIMADELLSGHLDVNLRKAVACGLPMEKAIYMTTFTPARRMGLNDRGMIAPGKIADFILLDNLEDFSIKEVYKSGRQVFSQGMEQVASEHDYSYYPSHYFDTLQTRKLTLEDVSLKVGTTLEKVRCQVIRKHKIGTFTEPVIKEIPVIDGYLDWESAECSLLIIMERYGKNRNISYSLIEKPIEEKGAIGTTWAHDHHNIMIMGNTKEDLLKVQHELIEMKGGYCVSHSQEIIGRCPLPLGGIVSTEPIAILGERLKEIRRGMQVIGYKNMNEIMSFSTLSLPVSPAIKVTDVGMMDTKTQVFYDLIHKEDGELLNGNTY
ncbi:adenine deaminase C-terminal domain-containing protein [Vagococcus hydrophili]|uniref:Adenine deaminase n=1 Tax=Vagococcus hydrophili TaxID=2714947 RepID=A0A6G8AQZ5_9ENTE|nr:adenine deaminase C-terminal domain-containing protein [Vagococcus hydrophili]QIL47362.1 amidohydrolase family protein [Vagococcus hydrophili]